jgi:peptidyl-prolyl cis-trans isomerase C
VLLAGLTARTHAQGTPPKAPAPAPAATPAQAPPAAPASATAAAKPVAVVNGEPIPMADLETVLKQAPPMAVQLPEDRKKQMQREALAMLIDEVLLAQFLKQNAPPVSPAEVDKKLADLVQEMKKQGKTLQDFCRDTNQTEAQVRTGLGKVMQWAAYARAHVSDADVEKYYRDCRDFFDGVTVKASHIVLRVPPTASDGEKAAARAKLTELRAQILANKIDFAEAAKQHSQCPSASGGGDVGYFPRKWVVEEAFAKAAFALPVGGISEIVETDYGLHLIKVTDRKAGQPADFAKIKEDVRDFCTEELRVQLLTQMRKAAKIEVNLP